MLLFAIISSNNQEIDELTNLFNCLQQSSLSASSGTHLSLQITNSFMQAHHLNTVDISHFTD